MQSLHCDDGGSLRLRLEPLASDLYFPLEERERTVMIRGPASSEGTLALARAEAGPGPANDDDEGPCTSSPLKVMTRQMCFSTSSYMYVCIGTSYLYMLQYA